MRGFFWRHNIATQFQSVVAATDKLAAEVAQLFGKIDILFINAGIVGTAPIEQMTEALFDSIININFKGLILPSASLSLY